MSASTTDVNGGRAYRTRNLDKDLGHSNKGLVEVFDSLCGVFRRLVAHISNAAMGEELDVCDREFGEVLAYVVLSEPGRQAPHEDT